MNKQWVFFFGFFILALNLSMIAFFISPEAMIIRSFVALLSLACWTLVYKFRPR